MENFIFKGKEIVDPFWEIFMAHVKNDGHVKNEVSQYGVKNFQVVKRSLVVIGYVLFLFGNQIVLILRRMR